MTNIFLPDPEGIPEEEAELTYRLQEAVHDFEDANRTGKCSAPVKKFCYEHKIIDYHNECGSPSYSVLHIQHEPDGNDIEDWDSEY